MGAFADPADGCPVDSPLLRPVDGGTTDPALVREWWPARAAHMPNVLTVTGEGLGAFIAFDFLAEAVAMDSRFAARPTPVLAIQGMPVAYFLVRPPSPTVLLSHGARVLDPGVPMPLSPSTLGDTAVMWLVTPGEAGNTLMARDELADLIRSLEGA